MGNVTTDSREDTSVLHSLGGSFSHDDISMALTTAGLLPDQMEELVHLYAEELSWNAAAERWHEARSAGRGSRESAQKILKLIRERLNAADDSLPTLRQLDRLLEAESSTTARAQVLYLYLVQADDLVRFVVHALFRDQGWDRPQWDLSKPTVRNYLSGFRYEDGSQLEYADSTLGRWAEGFRSVLREIGVRRSKYGDEGEAPALRDTPLAVAAGHSWHRAGEGWEEAPIGWLYLFQPKDGWRSLRDRLLDLPGWERTQSPRGRTLRPVIDPFSVDAVGR
jgi:hypothetical protein